MNRRRHWRGLILIAALAALVQTACVERTARIQTKPSGAVVIVNDEEVGVSPVKFNFLWYGDYDIIVRKPGYETLKTHYRIDAPWYEWPPIDIISETMILAMVHDDHTLPTFELQPAQTPTAEDLVKRATELRERSLFEAE
jgi:hypothetical protein